MVMMAQESPGLYLQGCAMTGVVCRRGGEADGVHLYFIAAVLRFSGAQHFLPTGEARDPCVGL